MQINMAKVLAKDQELQLHDEVKLNIDSDHKQITSCSPISARLTVKPSVGLVEVEGELKIQLNLLCSRCLTAYTQELTVPFDELFTNSKSYADERNDDDEEIHIVTEPAVDLAPYIEENIQLAVPFVPLCKEDCKGLCPVCGNNRNQQECGCKQERIDPRLAGLKDFFEK